jgi:integrase
MARMQSASQAIITCTGWCCRALYERQHRRRTRASTVLGRSSYSQMHPQPSIKEDEHKPEGHAYQRDNSLPHWHGWHAFRRGVATNLHDLGVDDKTIQAILRHSNIGITQNIYIKSVNKSQVSAMDTLSENLGICNDLATNGTETIQ